MRTPSKLLPDIDYTIDGGKIILTEAFLLRRGFCCNTRCRHCPYKGERASAPIVILGMPAGASGAPLHARGARPQAATPRVPLGGAAQVPADAATHALDTPLGVTPASLTPAVVAPAMVAPATVAPATVAPATVAPAGGTPAMGAEPITKSD